MLEFAAWQKSFLTLLLELTYQLAPMSDRPNGLVPPKLVAVVVHSKLLKISVGV
jgi:hypothetical protein